MPKPSPEFMAARRRLLFPVASEGAQPFADVAGVHFESRGMALVVGPAARALPVAHKLAEKLHVLVCAPDAAPGGGVYANPTVMAAGGVTLAGFLGRFSAKVAAGDGQWMDLGAFSVNPDAYFDMVLDLEDKPLITAQVTPLGYFAPGKNPQTLDAVVAEMCGLVGHFRKPRYVKFDPDLCTHAAQGVTGCFRCIDACPTLVIRSKGAVVEVNPFLCQGCAACTQVCPTGAISYATPVPALAPVPAGEPHTLWVREYGDAQAPCLPVHSPDTIHSVSLTVAAIASVGLADWLQALTRGYQQVRMCLPAGLPERIRTHIQAQVTLAQALTSACGWPADSVVLQEAFRADTDQAAQNAPPASVGTPLPEAATRPPLARGRRDSVMASLYLLEQTRPSSSGVLADAHPLSVGSEFGSLQVDPKSCTLCMACVNLCPTHALSSPEDGERSLQFVESRCVQCGICARGCPEQAITLQSRLLISDAARQAKRTLNQDTTHRCTECGAGYISTALLAKSLQIMQRTRALDTRGVALMCMCPSCRSQLAN
jgi:ferredoxin